MIVERESIHDRNVIGNSNRRRESISLKKEKMARSIFVIFPADTKTWKRKGGRSGG